MTQAEAVSHRFGVDVGLRQPVAVRDKMTAGNRGDVRPFYERDMMASRPSYFSKAYAPAWGMLIGTGAGVPIDLTIHGSGAVTGVLAMLGLIVGTVIYYEDTSSGKNMGESNGDSREARLRELDRLRSNSLISELEYELKREEILSRL